MIGHGVISSYEDGKVRVISRDVPGYITPPLSIPSHITVGGLPVPGTLVIYAEFDDATGAILAVLKE